MHKLSLDLDALVVDSFDTAPAGTRLGTVLGHEEDALAPNSLKPDACGCSVIDSCPTRACSFDDFTCFDQTCVKTCGDFCLQPV